MDNYKLNKIFIFIILLQLSEPLSSIAFAQPHLLEGSFRLERTTQIGDLQFIRSYSSRSTRRGLFGFGWCSPLENSLIEKSNVVEITDCPSRTPTIFKKNSAAIRRQRFLSSLGHDSVTTKQNLVISNNHGLLEKKEEQWVWSKKDGTRQIFDKNGRLIMSRDRLHQDSRFIYDTKGRLSQIMRRKGEKVILKYEDYFIAAMTSKDQTLSFSYRDLNLVRVKKSGNEDEFYKYDELNNLIFLSPTSSQGVQELAYDSQDRLIFIGYSNSCSDKFDFTVLKPKITAIHKMRSCGSGVIQSTYYKFMYQQQHGQQRTLSSVEIVKDQDKKIITFTGESLAQPKNL